jgi:hypothetical protein
MARRTVRHATRGITAGIAGPDQGLAPQVRVMTIDGLPGRILFVSQAFAPGVSEYEVLLDSGMGQGAYTASQLRVLPESFRGGSPGSNLPAGVTAAAIEAELRTADLDYPEMGSILHDRPDPGQEIRVIGSRTAADTYGRPDDARDEDYNGGEGDTGLYWAEPGQQDWVHQNLGPQEEAPPPAYLLSPPMARLAEIEEASALIGGTRATTINGTEIDQAGDAPQHGTIPRADDPDGYDEESAEGEGDDRWNQPLPGVDKNRANAATVGMYPEGMSAGGGPGLEIGAFTARHVPWTGEQRGDLHDWDNGAAATRGDFVPSTEFTNRHPVIDEPESQELESAERQVREAARHEAASEEYWARHLIQQHGWAPPGVERVTARGDRVSDMHDAIHDAGLASHAHQALTVPFDPGQPGHERPASADELSASRPGQVLDPEQWSDYTRRHRLSSKPEGLPADPPEDDALGERQDPEDTGGEPGQAPEEWPLAGAAITSGGTAYTQGTHDQHGNVWPPPPPPAPSAPPGQEEDGSDGSDGDDSGKTVEVHLGAFAAAQDSASFRFEFTASWADVRRKATRIRKSGRVRITHVSPGLVIGEVGGDHDVYESGIQRRPGHPQSMQHWACGCPWASFHQDKGIGTRYAGRPCSHVMALQFESLSRTRTGQGVSEDDPAGAHQVVVKSMPPWTPGGWAQTWTAPLASKRAGALPYAREPEDYELRRHLESHHGLAGHLDTAGETEMAVFHEAEHHDHSGEQGHQHHGPSAVDRAYPDKFVPHSVDDHGGYDRPGEGIGWGGPSRDEFFGEHPLGGQFTPGRPHHHMLSALQHRPVECYYEHDGDCPSGELEVTGRSLHHPRPSGLEITDTGNPDHDPDFPRDHPLAPKYLASHVITAHLDGKTAGRLHYSQSDDGRAHAVGMLHSRVSGKGVASALMDHLYSKAKAADGWISHGIRTDQGNSWWSAYEEPHPEVNTHHMHPDKGWHKYFAPFDEAMHAEENLEGSKGRGAHTPVKWNPMAYPHDSHPEMWTRASGTAEPPVKRAVAALIAAGEDLGDVLALAALASICVTADQANGPWGSENVTRHPPAQPYGATEPPNPDTDPGSYGPLAGPDPDNWGAIDDSSFIQMPLSNAAALAAHEVLAPGAPDPLPPGLNVPSIADQENQGTFAWTDRSGTAGPATGMSPADPQGIRMDGSLSPADDAESYRRHMVEHHGYPADEPGLPLYHEGHARDHENVERGMAAGDPAPPGYTPHPYHETDHEQRHGRGSWPDAGQSHGFVAELHDEPEPALPSTTGEEDDGEDQRQAAGIDGTAGDAQDVPHPYGGPPDGTCPACGMNDGASVHMAAAAQGDPSEGTQLATGEPGMGSMDDALGPEDPSIQTIGNQQWSGGGTDSGEVDVPAGQPQGSVDDIVASFQRSAAGQQLGSGGPAGGETDIAGAARAYLAKTADVLPETEAAELIGEGRGTRARNLGLLHLKGTHYEGEDEDLARRGLSLDDYDDDVISV